MIDDEFHAYAYDETNQQLSTTTTAAAEEAADKSYLDFDASNHQMFVEYIKAKLSNIIKVKRWEILVVVLQYLISLFSRTNHYSTISIRIFRFPNFVSCLASNMASR